MGHLFAENRAVFAAGLVCIPTCVLQHFSCTQKRGILWILWFLGGSMVCLTLLEMYQVQFSCVWGQDDWLKHSEIFSLPSWVIECPRFSMIFTDPSLSVSEQFRPQTQVLGKKTPVFTFRKRQVDEPVLKTQEWMRPVAVRRLLCSFSLSHQDRPRNKGETFVQAV